MLCPSCKREIKDGASICRLCGYVVDDALRNDDDDDGSTRTHRSGFTQVREAPVTPARPVVPTGVRRPGDAPGGFVDVAPTVVAANNLSTSDGDDDDGDAIEHAEKTLTSAPPQMSAAVAAPAPSLADIEDLLDGETVRARAAVTAEHTDIVSGIRAQPLDAPVDDEKTQVNATEPLPPAPRSKR